MVEHVPRNHKKNKKYRVSDVKLPTEKKLDTQIHKAHLRSTRSFDAYEHRQSPLRLFVRALVSTFIVVGLVIFLGSRLFARAHLTIVPHTLEGDVDTILAFVDTVSGSVYETMTLRREKVQQIPIEDFETAQKKSSGTIVVFNEESRPQRLQEETRFETPNGLIFMMGEGAGVTIPGAEGSIPGSVEVMVYAQEPGDIYNIDPSDFVIPGWREINDPRFVTQYARSTGPMSAGGNDPVPVISLELRESITQDMRATLRNQMIAQAWVNAPDDFIIFEDIVDISFGPLILSEVNTETMSATASMTGTLSAVLFDHDQLARVFAQEIIDDYNQEVIRIDNPSQITTMISPPSKVVLGWSTDPERTLEVGTVPMETMITTELESGPDTIRVRFIGTPKMTMYIDQQKTIEDLSGMHMRDITDYFAQISEIRTASVSIKPFWRRTIPDVRHISLIINTQL